MRFTNLLLALAFTVSLNLITAVDAQGQQRAILIGVAEYPHLSKSHELVGPENDVKLIDHFLQSRGFARDHITVLNDQSDSALLPNKLNIQRVLTEHIDTSQPGDFLYIHFSGHGSQQPDLSGEEIDGLNEIFLARDTKQWDGSAGTVINAITDNEISEFLSKFREKGAFVWLVFDSCHSGTMTRNSWRSRKLNPQMLGVPKTRSAGATADSNPIDQQAGYVAFFAAQTTEETPEMKLPKRAQEPTVLGLFTFHLIETLRANPTATYRQIADQIVQRYQAQPWYGSRPMFIGQEMDRVIFSDQARSIEQWPINVSSEGWQIPAGYLSGIHSGTTFDILAKPTDEANAALGEATVVETSATFSLLATDQNLTLPSLPFARLKQRAIPLGLDLAIIDTPDAPMSSRARKILKQLGTTEHRWVDAAEPADVRFLERNNQLVLLTDGEPLPCLKGSKNPTCEQTGRKYLQERLLGNPKMIAGKIESHLNKINRALNLMRLGTTIGMDGLETQLQVMRASDQSQQDFHRGEVPTLYEGDKLSLYVANFLDEPMDITILFVGSDYSIDLVFPRGGAFNRFMLEEERVIPLGTINTDTLGTERVIVIASQSTNAGTPTNYSFLTQEGVTKTRSAKTTALSNLFEQAGFTGLKTRSAAASLEAQGDIHTLSWITAKQ